MDKNKVLILQFIFEVIKNYQWCNSFSTTHQQWTYISIATSFTEPNCCTAMPVVEKLPFLPTLHPHPWNTKIYIFWSWFENRFAFDCIYVHHLKLVIQITVISQKEGVDYDEIFAPFSWYTTIWFIVARVASQGRRLHQMDIKIAFLHGSLKEEVYVEQPETFEVQDRRTHMWRLKKSLYGLKQTPRAWYERIDNYLMKLGFIRSEANPNLYFKVEKDMPLILVLYVDDLFLTSADPLIYQCKRELASEFEMKDLGLVHYFLFMWFGKCSQNKFYQIPVSGIVYVISLDLFK